MFSKLTIKTIQSHLAFILGNNKCVYKTYGVIQFVLTNSHFFLTVCLLFSVEWFEPRLNLSQDLWGPGNVASQEDLVPGKDVNSFKPVTPRRHSSNSLAYRPIIPCNTFHSGPFCPLCRKIR